MSQELTSRSPWALHGYKEAIVSPVQGPINGSLRVPGSKSYTNRALILAALAKGKSTLTGFLKSDDAYWCIESLRRLGIQLEMEEDEITIEGCNGQWPVKEAELFIGAAGTIARFLPGALAVCQGGSWQIDGIEQLRGRPLSPLIDALRKLGAEIDYQSAQEGLPIRVKGTGLRGGSITIPGHVSSQFLSGLLIASSYARDPVTIQVEHGLVQPDYIGITLQLMKQFGAKVEHDEGYERFTVYPTGYTGGEITLEADASTANYFLTLAALTGGRVRVENVGYHSYQPDAKFIDILEMMGCEVDKGETYLEVKGAKQLRGGFDIDMKPMSDQALTIAALAPFADAPINVYNVAHIRTHESDRIAVICQALTKMGIKVEEREDGFKIYPGTPRGARLNPHDDHRQAMVFALLSVKVPGIVIEDPGCVSKTCPGFFSELQKLGVQVALKK